eukprot:TRINITY_DN538_c0_g3_i1.p1 TRINITY_DN538_c0_g3~~TRINITY_DN538_c0_g3_i1.p1  ORF type:complete len:583 (+),score=175.13 TRINITY_DN538_c0_g3_i1:67-1815(+)
MAEFFPISELSAYQGKWTIRGRVTNKAPLRTFGNGGKVFSVELQDGPGSEIRASFFGEAAAKYVDVLQLNKVFTFSRGNVKIANKQYNSTNHKYELVFDKDAQVEEYKGQMEEFKTTYNFTDFLALQSKTVPMRVDICGVVTSYAPHTNVNGKDGKILIKRDITLVDDTKIKVAVTLWSDLATQADKLFEGNPIIALKGVLLKEWNGEKSASTVDATKQEWNPELPDVQRIKAWWAAGGSQQSFTNYTNLQAVQSKPLPVRVDLCGVITSFKDVARVQAKDGKELVKRDVTIADDTGYSMEVTLWNEAGTRPEADYMGNPTVLIHGVLIKEFNGGRNGSTIPATTIEFNSVNEDAQRLARWWKEGGSSQNLTSLRGAAGTGGAAAANAEKLSVGELRKRGDLLTETPQLFKVTARNGGVQTRRLGEQIPLHYLACAELKDGQYGQLPCNKRVDASGVCPSCQRAGKTQVRLNIRTRVSDFSDSMWMTTFHEAAEKVLNMPGEKVAEVDVGADGREKMEELMKQHYFGEPLEFTIRAKLDIYQGEPRTNVTCAGIGPVNRREHGRRMLAEIQEMLNVGAAAGA